MHACIHTYIHACMHAYIYIHACIHTCIHACTHTLHAQLHIHTHSRTGIKTDYAKVKNYMPDYIDFIQTYGGCDLEKTINEIHHDTDEPDDDPIRRGLDMPAWDFEECYNQNQLVLETVV